MVSNQTWTDEEINRAEDAYAKQVGRHIRYTNVMRVALDAAGAVPLREYRALCEALKVMYDEAKLIGWGEPEKPMASKDHEAIPKICGAAKSALDRAREVLGE